MMGTKQDGGEGDGCNKLFQSIVGCPGCPIIHRAQVRALREYASNHGYRVVREFIDEAESSRSDARPAFREMIALAKTKPPPFEAILVWKLNRFARSRMDSIVYKKLLKDRGIKVISITNRWTILRPATLPKV